MLACMMPFDCLCCRVLLLANLTLTLKLRGIPTRLHTRTHTQEYLGKSGRRFTRSGWVPDLLMWPGAAGPASGQPPAAARPAEDAAPAGVCAAYKDVQQAAGSRHAGLEAETEDESDDAAKWAAVQADGASVSHDVAAAAAATAASNRPAFPLVLLGSLFDVDAALNAARKLQARQAAAAALGSDRETALTPRPSGSKASKAQSAGKQHAKQLHAGPSVTLTPHQHTALCKAGWTKAQIAAGARKGLSKKQAACLRKLGMPASGTPAPAGLTPSHSVGQPSAGSQHSPMQPLVSTVMSKRERKRARAETELEDDQHQADTPAAGGSRRRGRGGHPSRSETRAAKRQARRASGSAGGEADSLDVPSPWHDGSGGSRGRGKKAGRQGGQRGGKAGGGRGRGGGGERGGRKKARGGWVGV